MANYFYAAKSKDGQEKTGRMEAQDEKQLASLLRQEGYVLILAEKEKESSKRNLNDITLPFLNGVSLKEKLFFTRNLRVMVSAGISLPRALGTLADITKNKKFKDALLKIVEVVDKGETFSSALSKYPDIFSEIFCSLVRAGEESGTLEDALKNINRQLERQNELRSKIKGAMMYPMVILVAMLGIGTAMIIMIVPKLAAVFVDLGATLPVTTKVLIALANFLTHDWYFVPVGLIILIAAFRFLIKTKSGKRFFDKFSLKIPIIAPLVQKTNSAYTARTISSLTSSGVPIVKSLEITAGVLGNVYFKQALLGSADVVRKGGKLSDALKSYGNLYPLVVVQMIQVGEETGETADILEKLADFYEEEVAAATANMSSIIEPVLMLIIGAAVGMFAVSIIGPMYSVMGQIQ